MGNLWATSGKSEASQWATCGQPVGSQWAASGQWPLSDLSRTSSSSIALSPTLQVRKFALGALYNMMEYGVASDESASDFLAEQLRQRRIQDVVEAMRSRSPWVPYYVMQ